MQTKLQLAIEWHKSGGKMAPNAPSYQHTKVILDELNQAVALLKTMMDDPLSADDILKMEDFLITHTGAPYV